MGGLGADGIEGAKGVVILTQSLVGDQQGQGGQPNSSSAATAKAFSQVALPDAKVLRASDHFPEGEVDGTRRDFCSSK